MTFNKSLLIPLGVFVLLVVFLALGFRLQDPRLLPSVLIDKPFPEFELQDLRQPDQLRTLADLSGEVSLVNVWATWCFACRIEHPMLNQLADQGVAIVGINYKDQDAKAKSWLEQRGNPYQFNIVDTQGSLGFDLGVTGAPETYLVDAQGVIQYRRVGVVDQRVWDDEFKTLYNQLMDEEK